MARPLPTLIQVYTHYFKVTNMTPHILSVVNSFSQKLTRWSWVKEPGQKPAMRPTHLFGVKLKNLSEFRFHVGFLKEFMEHMNRQGVWSGSIKTVVQPVYEPVSIQAHLKPTICLRDYQDQGVTHILDPSIEGFSRVLGFGTGLGKTVTSLAAIAKLGKRTAIVILPQYMEKWASDIPTSLDTPVSKIMSVQGSAQLRGLIHLAEEGELTSDFLIFSVTTLQNYYKLYEDVGEEITDMEYCVPDRLWEVLGVGTVLVDETHQHINSVYRTMMYTHVPRFIALSATLISEEPVVKKVHEAMYPSKCRFAGPGMAKYIKLYPVSFNFDMQILKHIKTTEFGSNTYSHTAFEKSIMRNHNLKRSYYRMVEHFVDRGYLEHRTSGDKMIIYAATIAMCTDLTEHLKKLYPQLDIRRYVEDDPFENAIESDIRVTTVLSCGTAIDIPNLITGLQTVNISSAVSNLQSIGRLRNIPGKTMRFYYTYCQQISKHVEYHQRRLEMFRDRVESQKDYPYIPLIHQ